MAIWWRPQNTGDLISSSINAFPVLSSILFFSTYTNNKMVLFKDKVPLRRAEDNKSFLNQKQCKLSSWQGLLMVVVLFGDIARERCYSFWEQRAQDNAPWRLGNK